MTFRFRRGGLAAALSLGVISAAAIATAVPAHAAAASFDTIPLTIVDKSGLKGDWFVFVTGQTPDGTNYYVTNTAGGVSTFPLTKPGVVAPYLPYGLPFGRGTTMKLDVPKLSSTRIYVSYGRKMYFQSNPAGAPSTPSVWKTTDKNYKTLYDWAEYTWTSKGTMPPNLSSVLNGNLTQVDMLGVPMLMKFFGRDGNDAGVVEAAGFARPNARKQILKAFKKAGSPWNKLVIGAKKKYPLRVIAPDHGMKAVVNKRTLFPANQLDDYIDDVFTTYETKTMTAYANSGADATFNGQVSGGNLVFTQEGTPANTVTFAKPTSEEAYLGYAGTPSNTNGNLPGQATQLEEMLQAGFMRSTLLTMPTISACPNPKSTYYKNDPVNMYSKTMHRFGFENLAYGFSYDDWCSQSSDITVFDPTGILLTIQKVPPMKGQRRHHHRRR
jgi:Beta-1,3-glucanase